MNRPPPLVIALVSGKGGVGKTMLSVAVAKELSLSNRTLIVDLDFFNRGLTGLMADGPTSCEIDKPGFLLEDDSEVTIKWSIVQVAKNLFHIKYPDLLPEEMQRFETLDINVLKESLKDFIQEAAEKCNCSCVVLDCHGGPDNSSFAACLFSDYSLLVSEPDRITFYGTLNFLRQLRRIGGEQQVNLHLVFNKVVPAFSGLFLRSLYDRLIRKEFSGRPLLAIFPLEVYLTKEFEKTPFLTEVYPYSYLAKKTRTLLCDLLSEKHRERLPPVARSIPRWVQAYTRLTLGRQIPLLSMNVVMLAIVTVVVFLALLSLVLSQFYASTRQEFKTQASVINILQCLDKSEVVRNNPTVVVYDMIKRPDGYSSYLSRFYHRQIYDWREEKIRNLRELRLGELSFEKRRAIFEQQEAVTEKTLDEILAISSFRKCAYPNLDFSETEDSERELFSSRKISEIAWSGRLSGFLDESDDQFNSPKPVPEPAPFLVFRARRELLNNLKRSVVPETYRADYNVAVQKVSDISPLYLVLQAITETAFSPFGSRSLAFAAAGWLSVVLLLTWSQQLDRRFTYYSRLRRVGSLTIPYLGVFILWFLPLVGGAIVIRTMASAIQANPASSWLKILAGLLALLPLFLGLGQILRAYKNLRYERKYVEGYLRIGFVIYLIAGPIALYLLFKL